MSWLKHLPPVRWHIAVVKWIMRWALRFQPSGGLPALFACALTLFIPTAVLLGVFYIPIFTWAKSDGLTFLVMSPVIIMLLPAQHSMNLLSRLMRERMFHRSYEELAQLKSTKEWASS